MHSMQWMTPVWQLNQADQTGVYRTASISYSSYLRLVYHASTPQGCCCCCCSGSLRRNQEAAAKHIGGAAKMDAKADYSQTPRNGPQVSHRQSSLTKNVRSGESARQRTWDDVLRNIKNCLAAVMPRR